MNRDSPLQKGKRLDIWAICGIVLLLVFLYVMATGVHPTFTIPNTDDYVSSHNANDQGFWRFLSVQYLTWSGRMGIFLIYYLALRTGALLYWLTTPLLILLTGICIARLFSEEIRLRSVLTATFALGLIDQYVIGDSVFWYTGSYFYLVPVVLALLTAVPYADSYFRHKNRLPIPWFIFACATALLAGAGTEQAAVVLLGAAVIFHIQKWIHKEKISPQFYGITLFLLAGVLISLLAPGDAKRGAADISWFPGFNTLSFSAHLKIWTYFLYNSVFVNMTVLVLAVSIIPIALFRRFRGRTRYVFYVFLVLFGFAAASKLIQINPSLSQCDFLYKFTFLKTYYNTDITQVMHGMSRLTLLLGILPYVFWAIYTVLLVFLVSVASEKPVFTALCFFAAFLTFAVMFYSATMFASTNRVFYVGSVLLVIIFYQFLKQSRVTENPRVILPLSCIFFINLGTIYLAWWQSGYFILMKDFS